MNYKELFMGTMKIAAITGVKTFSLLDHVIPTPKDDWVLVKVRAIPLCTEYKNWLTGNPYGGHEAAGEVVAIGSYSTKRKVGDRVVVMPGWPCGVCDLCVRGEYIHCEHWQDYHEMTGTDLGGDTHVQYLLKQDWLLAPIPDGVSFERAALACCGLGPTFGALERFSAGVFDTVLITGAGAVGLGGVVNAKYRGCRVVSVDSIEYRRNLAKTLGADITLDPNDPDLLKKIRDLSDGGVTLALETSGQNAAARTCLDALRRHGKMAFIGENGEISVHVSNDFIRKGITVTGQWHYNLNGIPKIMEVIKKSPAAEKMITHRFSFSTINEALAVSASHQCGKIMIDPWN
jgi:L-iditol 2-dehydrogenase